MIQIIDHFRDLFEYMRWGDERMLAAAGMVSPEGYFREQNISAGSIHKLLAHAMGSQIMWLGRWRGETAPSFPSAERFPTLDSLIAHWPRVHSALFAFLVEQTPESLERIVHFQRSGKPMSGQLFRLMQHVVDHAAYHRGQLNSMIKLAGGRPVDVMYAGYRRMVEGIA